MNTKNRLNPTKTKRNLKELPLFNQTKLSSLQEHTNKIEQKLNLLKEKIELKKKTKKVQQKKQQQKQYQPQFVSFLQSIGMSIYKQKLINNHIDSFQILSEATQKELQQLAIPKGHCIKIITNIQKLKKAKIQSIKNQVQEKNKKQYFRQLKTKESDRVINHDQMMQKDVQSICIGYESIPIETKKSCFCLYCYKKSQESFCSSNCSTNYNTMFKKYEDNLQRAELNFKKSNKTEQQQSQQDDEKDEQGESVQNFDFLDGCYLQVQDFDYKSYQQLKKQLE